MEAILRRCHGVHSFSRDDDIVTVQIALESGKRVKEC